MRLFLLILISLFSAQLKWYFDLGIRVNIYELFIILFIVILSADSISKDAVYIPNRLHRYILFLFGLVLITIFSGFTLLYNPQSSDSVDYFTKNFIQLIVYTLFFVYLMIYLSKVSFEKKELLLKIYVWGVIVSSIYGLAQIIAIMKYGIDLDLYVSSKIPFFQETAREFESQGYGVTYRLSGLPGDPNVHASYAMTALPLIYYFVIERRQWFYAMLGMVVIFSVILSLSVSGSIACLVSTVVFIFIFFKKKDILKIISIVLVVSIPVLSIYFMYEEEVSALASTKLNPEGSGLGRYEIVMQSLTIFRDNPLGVGSGCYAPAYERAFHIPKYNPHNSWIAILVELGIIGFLVQIFFSIYIFVRAFKAKNALGKILISTYTGICIAALGYSSLNLFFTQFIITLLFTVSVLDQSVKDK
jgi:O-antigen ligase